MIVHYTSHSYSFDAPASSMSQTMSPVTREAGTNESPLDELFLMMVAAISALPSPTAVKHFDFAAFTTGRENVIRSGGGLGESEIGNIQGSVTLRRAWSGKSEHI